MSKYLIFLIGLCLAITSCVDSAQERLIPSGKKIFIPQVSEFCRDNPGDSICSQ